MEYSTKPEKNKGLKGDLGGNGPLAIALPLCPCTGDRFLKRSL
jgi:hypothetical protein